jgi:3-oxoacyl-[acyl-carrier protein] reductase
MDLGLAGKTAVVAGGAALPGMKARRWGRLLNIGSVAMKVPHLEDPMPAVNIRVAVNAVMKTLAQEYGPY